MNIYFLVEGRRTEKIVYPKWLGHLIPEISQVYNPFEVKSRNYYLFNGNGYPSLLDNHLVNSIADVNAIKKFSYLVICLDCDDTSVAQRRLEVSAFMQKNNLKLKNSELVIIAQDKCIESWLLGNRKVYSRQPQSADLRRYNNFYNVQLNNPELMTKMPDFNTSAQFHEAYLCEMFRERKMHYSKRKPDVVVEKHYLMELISRQSSTNHLLTFKDFVEFCIRVRKLL